MTTLEIFTAVRDVLRAIPLDPELDPDGAKLFEDMQLAPNKQLAEQLESLLVTKARVGLLVPLSIRREIADESGGLSVLGTKHAEIALIYSDRAYFKSGQAVTFGSENNLGLFTLDERIEAALCGREISPFGGIVPGDSDPLPLSIGEQKAAAGRWAWLMTILVPIGDLRYAVG